MLLVSAVNFGIAAIAAGLPERLLNAGSYRYGVLAKVVAVSPVKGYLPPPAHSITAHLGKHKAVASTAGYEQHFYLLFTRALFDDSHGYAAAHKARQ